MDLASYVHQLRGHLPKASALIGGRPPDGGVAERARADMEREASSRSLGSEGYAAEFMDQSITSRWDKQKPKVCMSWNYMDLMGFPLGIWLSLAIVIFTNPGLITADIRVNVVGCREIALF
jgi:hypothetical protein